MKNSVTISKIARIDARLNYVKKAAIKRITKHDI
jgi:hypothetical protein